MRYTRKNQMSRINKNWKDVENIPIEVACKYVCPEDLDPTFKWHREYNNVSFNTKIYYPHEHITKLFVDLYRQDSVYY